MRFLPISFFAVLALAAVARAESLESKITPLLASPVLKSASIGIEVQEITPHGGSILFSQNAAAPLVPASNCKLLTTAAALEKYGPNAAFKTQLYKVGPDLVLMGGGDPGFGDAKLAAAAGETPTTPFEQWAAVLRAAGITQYRDLILDDRVFDTQWTHPNWLAADLAKEFAAPIGGLNFNANCLDWTPKLTASGISLDLVPSNTSSIAVSIKASRGAASKISLVRLDKFNHFELRGTLSASVATPYSTPIYDPGLWTGAILRDILANDGIQATGALRRATPDERLPPGTLLASHDTPLLSVIGRANTNSLNMMAECLCKRLGYDSTGGRQPGSWANGAAAVEAFVTSLGVPANQLALDDGSGLSTKNHASAHAFVTVLAHVAARPDGADFIETLAQPREDGTLVKRFKGMSAAEHIRAKTGHMDGISTLSGYILMDDSNGRRFVFSILVNKKQDVVDAWQDQVCQTIYAWAGGK